MSEQVKYYLTAVFILAGLAVYALPTPAQMATSYRVGAVVAGCALGVLVFWFTEARVSLIQLIKHARDELVKVVWPTRRETMIFTGVVILFAIAIALYTWVIDKGLEYVLYQLILKL